MLSKPFQALVFILSTLLFLELGIQKVQAEDSCKSIFGSRFHYDKQVLKQQEEYKKFHSKFSDINEERNLQKQWNNLENAPGLFQKALPKDVGFIPRQLRQPQFPTSVKLEESGSASIVRASYKYKNYTLTTNVTMSKKALFDNVTHSVKGLAGVNAKAAVLFLHGGGTKSTGGHVAEALVNHFSAYNIDIVSPDLPWHAEGPREFVGNLTEEIMSISEFTKKYIPENVPLFIWGHSWGAGYAEEIMRMTEDPNFSFHSNLKGIIIASPPVDSAPGKSWEEKNKNGKERYDHMMENLKDRFSPRETNIWTEMIEEGKTSLVGSLFAGLTMAQADQSLPQHGGDKYIPSIMIVGEGDPLVFVGNEDLFHNYYDKLSNVTPYYLKKLPLVENPKGDSKKVGHLIRDYLDPATKIMPVDFYYVKEFIKEQLNIDKLEKKAQFRHTNFSELVHLYTNNLSFRLWIDDYFHFHNYKKEEFRALREEKEKLKKEIITIFLNYIPINRLNNLISTIKDSHNTESVESIKNETDYLLHHFSNDKGTNLRLNTLLSDLKQSKDKISMQAVLTKHFEKGDNFIPKPIASIKSRTQSLDLIRKILEPEDNKFLGELIKLLKLDIDIPTDRESRLNLRSLALDKLIIEPFSVAQEHKVQLKEYTDVIFKISDIMSDFYIPSAKEIKEYQPTLPPNEIIQTIHDIQKNIRERLTLEIYKKEILGKRNQVHVEYKNILESVIINIKHIKLAFSKALQSIPSGSLKDKYKKSAKELDVLFKTAEYVEHMLSDISTQLLDSKNKDAAKIHNMLNSSPYKENTKKVSELYIKYVNNRTELRKELIIAIEKGELGEDFKKNVLAIYGEGSKGLASIARKNKNTLYSKLGNLTKELAELEYEILKIKTRESALLTKYYELSVNSVGGTEVYKLSDVLNGKKDGKEISLEDIEEIKTFIEANSSFFEKIYTIWKKLESRIPPEFLTLEQ